MLFSYSTKLTPVDLVKMVLKTPKNITNECCGPSFIDISEGWKTIFTQGSPTSNTINGSETFLCLYNIKEPILTWKITFRFMGLCETKDFMAYIHWTYLKVKIYDAFWLFA